MTNDIYRTSRKDTDFFTPDNRGTSNAFTDALRRNRMQVALTLFLLVLIIGLVVFIAVQQNLPSDTVGFTPAGAVAPTGPAAWNSAVPAWAPALGENDALLLEELRFHAEIAQAPTDSTKETGLGVEQLKQAAYWLLQAEQAQREGDRTAALQRYQRLMELVPELNGLHSLIGMMHMEQRDYEAAATAFETAMQREPVTFGLANNLAVTYLHLGEHTRAEQAFLEALRLRPNYPAAHFNLASLYLREGQWESAVNHFASYLEHEPDNVSAVLSHASALIQLQRWQEAAQTLWRANDLSPGVPPIQFRLAQSLSQSGDTEAAVEVLREAIARVDTRHALSWLVRREFDPIRDHPAVVSWLDDFSGVDTTR